jgi:hypothetical protein
MLLKESRDSIKGVNKALEDINNLFLKLMELLILFKTPVLQITGHYMGFLQLQV